MKVSIVCPSWPPSLEGEGEHALQIGERLSERGHIVSVLTNRQAFPRRPAALAVHAIMTGWRWRNLSSLLRSLRRQQPDAVLLVFTPWQFGNHPMVTFLPTLLRWLRPSARLLVLFESSRTPPPGNVAVRLGRKILESLTGARGASYDFGTLLRDSAAVAVLGPSILDSLVSHAEGLAQRALVIPPSPLVASPTAASLAPRERARIRAALGIDSDALVLAYFGYVYRGKGLETLLEAMRLLLQDSAPSTHLLMVGGGRGVPQAAGEPSRHAAYEASLVELSQTLGVSARVHWLGGYETGSDAPGEALVAADMAVLPFDDGAELRRSSIAVVAAAGLPLVTTLPSYREPAFEHGQTAYLVKASAPHELRNAVLRIAGDPALRVTLRRGASELHQRHYSWGAAIDSIERALQAG